MNRSVVVLKQQSRPQDQFLKLHLESISRPVETTTAGVSPYWMIVSVYYGEWRIEFRKQHHFIQISKKDCSVLAGC